MALVTAPGAWRHDDPRPDVVPELLIGDAPAALGDALVADSAARAARVRLEDLSDGVIVFIGGRAA